MNKKTIFIAMGILVIIVSIIGRILVYKNQQKKDLSNWSNENAKYTKCIQDAKALEENNKRIYDEVNEEVKKCVRDYIQEQGFDDNLWCVGTGETDPICYAGDEYDPNRAEDSKRVVERYNAEVDGLNSCEGQRQTLLEQKGYEEGIPAIDCIKYLGEE